MPAKCRTTQQVISILMQKVAEQWDDTNECWELNKHKKSKYPGISWKGGPKAAFHIIHEFLYGPIPEGYERHHKCKNTCCINPDHIKILAKKEHRSLHHKGSEKKAVIHANMLIKMSKIHGENECHSFHSPYQKQ